jgi:L-rhamnose mutarotase
MHKHLMIIKIKPECRDEYVAIHKKPWPEMLKAISDAGFHNELIWYYEDQSIIYFECEGDYNECNSRLRATDICKKWDIEMLPRFKDDAVMPEKIFDLRQQLEGKLLLD